MNPPGEQPEGTFARGCLSVLALYASAAAIVAVVWWAWPAGPDPTPPGPVPVATSPERTRAPATYPAGVDELLARAWSINGYGCAITGPAIDGLADVLERDVAEIPPLDARLVAAQWVRERCRGR